MAKMPNDTVLENYRRVHLPYERDMLAHTYEYLRLDHGPTINNALIESFCIHARNLIVFYRGSDRDDCIKAKHFTGGTYEPQHVGKGGEISEELYKKLNKQIAHMTDERTTDPAKKIGGEDRTTIMEALLREEAVFLSRV